MPHSFPVVLCLLITLLTSSASPSFEESDKNVGIAKERHRFESLLAGGRSLAFPFATGFVLTAASVNQKNWNISLNGFDGILNLSADQRQTAYKDAIESLKKDENMSINSRLYALQNWKSDSNSLKKFEDLQISIENVAWDEKTSNVTWNLMNDRISNQTNFLLDGQLLPKNTEIGNPFKFSTQSILVSTFYLKSSWKYPWTVVQRLEEAGTATTNQGSSVLRAEGSFLYAEEEDYTAVNMQLEGDGKSVVFILPKVNLTTYLKSRGSLRIRAKNDAEDFVSFPKSWTQRDLVVTVPSFNISHLDQYGKELEELGVNETFCTTIRDRKGAIPFYMRPIVQSNVAILNENFVEIASATGAAFEKFYFGVDITGSGYPKGKSEDKETEKTTGRKLNLQEQPNEKNSRPISGESNLDISETTPTFPEEEEKLVVAFNKPFLLYLNDAKLGAIFYGMIDPSQINEEKGLEEENSFTEEIQKYLAWSCKSFKQSAETEENVK